MPQCQEKQKQEQGWVSVLSEYPVWPSWSQSYNKLVFLMVNFKSEMFKNISASYLPHFPWYCHSARWTQLPTYWIRTLTSSAALLKPHTGMPKRKPTLVLLDKPTLKSEDGIGLIGTDWLRREVIPVFLQHVLYSGQLTTWTLLSGTCWPAACNPHADCVTMHDLPSPCSHWSWFYCCIYHELCSFNM